MKDEPFHELLKGVEQGGPVLALHAPTVRGRVASLDAFQAPADNDLHERRPW